MPKYYHVTSLTNYQKIIRSGYLKPQIGTNSKIINEPANQIYFFKSKLDASDGVCNWLGDLFEDGEPLVLITIQINYRLKSCEFEWTTNQHIDIQNIIKTQFNF